MGIGVGGFIDGIVLHQILLAVGGWLLQQKGAATFMRRHPGLA
jgi:uncharacterized membrane protein